MTGELLLALDVGSSSVRASLYGADGSPLPDRVARAPQRWRRDHEGQEVLDAKELLYTVAEVVDAVLAKLEPNQGIAAVGLATLAASLVGLDAQAEPLTPVYSYADTRSEAAVAHLKRHFGSALARIEEETGCPLHTAYWPAQLLHLSKHWPATAKVARWCDLSAFLYSCWFKEQPMSLSVASWTGLLNRYEGRWHGALLEALSVSPAQLPTLVDLGAAARRLTEPWRQRWPALQDALFYPPLGDGAAANLGSAGFTDDALVVTIGTTSAARVTVAGTPARPQGLWVYRIGGDYSLMGGALSEGGNGFAWLRERLRLPFELEAGLAALPPAAHGLTVLPMLWGERSPGWRADATGAVLGLRAETSNLELLRAFLEATTYRLAEVVERLPDRARVVASGGALTASRVWQGILADVLMKPVFPVTDAEVTSRGVAFFLAQERGASPAPCGLGKRVEPNPEHHAVHREAMAAQRALYRQLYGD